MTAKIHNDLTPNVNECQVMFRDDPNDNTKVIDNQKCLVTSYYNGGKWNRIVKKIVCEKLV